MGNCDNNEELYNQWMEGEMVDNISHPCALCWWHDESLFVTIVRYKETYATNETFNFNNEL